MFSGHPDVQSKGSDVPKNARMINISSVSDRYLNELSDLRLEK